MVWRAFSSRIPPFGLLLSSNQFVFNSRESLVKFLKSAEGGQDGLVEGIDVMLQKSDSSLDGLQPLFCCGILVPVVGFHVSRIFGKW